MAKVQLAGLTAATISVDACRRAFMRHANYLQQADLWAQILRDVLEKLQEPGKLNELNNNNL